MFCESLSLQVISPIVSCWIDTVLQRCARLQVTWSNPVLRMLGFEARRWNPIHLYGERRSLSAWLTKQSASRHSLCRLLPMLEMVAEEVTSRSETLSAAPFWGFYAASPASVSLTLRLDLIEMELDILPLVVLRSSTSTRRDPSRPHLTTGWYAPALKSTMRSRTSPSLCRSRAASTTRRIERENEKKEKVHHLGACPPRNKS